MILDNHALIKQLLYEYHTSLLGGHAKVDRILARISTQFYWKGMLKDVRFHTPVLMSAGQK